MDPSNPNNTNNPPQTPWTPPIDPMWATPQFSFTSYNQVPNAFNQLPQTPTPNAFTQLSQTPNPNAFTQLPQTPQPTSLFQLQQIQFQQQYQQQLKTLRQSQSRPIHTKVQSQPTPDTPSLDDLDDIAVVPETQPQSSKKTSTKKRSTRPEQENLTTGRGQTWTSIEELALARAWTNTSTCPIVGNNQKSGSFWKEVCNKFHALMQKEPYREVNSMSSKYGEMNKKISAFCGYYNNAHSNRPSGASDETVFAIAMSKYHTKEGSAFTYVGAWEIFKNCPKWAPVPNEVARAKRCKTFESIEHSAGDSDVRYHININDEPEFDDEVTEIPELKRPNGRDKAKKEAAAKNKETSTKNETPGETKVDKLMSKFTEFNEIQAARLKLKEKEMQEAADREDFKLMATNIDSLPEKDKEVLQKMKAKIAQKWSL
ncbi:putative glutathione transferase [Helianthus annuus]|uniref:glutathione S-transferase T3-like n=1 Tax=Helianthus annuus TaxID=4232 RepID=UPI000B8FD8F3|nr:glutathione S-transferase T3-like [Helianthus annuus]XP_035835027.1 glutathione S-transferase T3-like [Helianthus annuus]KAJ0501784.1 putative glutathione transferase [Helianthus annuus]KAJ0517709.1 putative glutathione transferase [Helianthus annuus]KAJ0685726.1 putative glutathione transferase [Helianthus annuus]KAJ0689601.1 putative glutathione transferase [Helianthus annuus]